MKTKKMTNQTKAMVTFVNTYLKERHIKNQDDHLFNDMQALLLEANCYAGFNYFTADGKLSGGNNEKFDHLQFYIM